MKTEEILSGIEKSQYNKKNDHFQLNAHMEISHTQDEVLAESKIEEEMADAIEVWKIYKLLQRLKSK